MREGITGTKTEFTETEYIQLVSHFFSTLNLYHGLYQSVREGILPEEYLSVIDNNPQLKSQLFETPWPENKPYFAGDFVECIEHQVLGAE